MKLPPPFTIDDLRSAIFKKSGRAVSPPAAGAAVHRPSTIVNRKSREGIALVITLILLSVTLVMAIAFLAISRRERGSVTTSTDTLTARLAADAALANAQAQIIATIYATTNPFSSGLIVSTNYQNGFGFVTGVSNPTNVNYVYGDETPLNNNPPNYDFEQNVANLLFLPRAPVFVTTNPGSPLDFRFYLDLNRNGQFEANGLVPVRGQTGGYLHPNGTEDNIFANVVTNFQIGDPEWIGVLERPDVTHGPNNKFVSRYAFVAVPADGALDLNAIHNETSTKTVNSSLGTVAEGYFRNQGVGSWEINLAAFLADLNTNEWNNPSTPGPYIYNEASTIPNPNTGYAFQDALALLSYRYNYNYNSLDTLQQVLGAPGYSAYANGRIDSYAAGKLMTNTQMPFLNIQPSDTPWAGADNTNHYFALSSDLFDTNKVGVGVTPPGFTDRLLDAGTNTFGGSTNSTYDRYTFYRLLSQLGTDSAPEQNKINLNYSNAFAYFDANGIVTNIVVFPNAETNLVPWQPLQFFTIAADRMLREYSASWFQASPSNYLATYYGINGYNYYYTDTGVIPNVIHTNDPSGVGLTNVPYFGLTNQVPAFGITNIPVLANGQFVYTPAVQRVLQLAANIYDATTNKSATFGKNYPSIFRPVLFKSVSVLATNVTIVGYQEISSIFPLTFRSAVLDLPSDVNSLRSGYTPLNHSPSLGPNQIGGNVYGVPWIIGAKKGFPNFNEFSVESIVQVTRKLKLTRTSVTSSTYAIASTNQNYLIGITNYFGAEFWNSYSNAYTNAQIIVHDNLSMTLTNNAVGLVGQAFYSFPPPAALPYNVGRWPGWTNGIQSSYSNSFMLPLGAGVTNFSVLPTAILRSSSGKFVDANSGFEDYPPAPLAQFGLLMTNRLQVFMLDNGHVIDYAHFSGPDSSRNLNAELADVASPGGLPAYLWNTNLTGTVPWGVINQINVSAGNSTLVAPQDGGNWDNPPGLPPALHLSGQLGENAIKAYFHGFLVPNGQYSFLGTDYVNTNMVMQAPYTPTRTMVQYVSWQANDPLVHYLVNDLNFSGMEADGLETGITTTNGTLSILSDLGRVNRLYQPWGQMYVQTGSANTAWNLACKDPLMNYSDNWDFPADKLPTVGWLGRVHRGTPWQTVYLKATNILSAANGVNTWMNWTGNTNAYDSVDTAPVQDRLLFDLFTTAINDNASRGQLSVNQTRLASWSALFSGVAIPPPSSTNIYEMITPAGVVGAPLPAVRPGLYSPYAMGYLVQNGTNGINDIRANTNFSPQQIFKHVGDILAVPALAEQSPFLNLANTNYNNDELYEWLPQQTMSLLRLSSAPRYVIYSYGQTLQPAPNGVVTGGSFFGMVTNYQVVAETITRAVVQVNQVVTTNAIGTLSTNYNTTIEQFNVLPPD